LFSEHDFENLKVCKNVNKKRPQELPAALAILLHFRLVVPAWIIQFKPPPEIAIDHISVFVLFQWTKI